MSEHIPSPCINICALDDKDICTGCFRSGEEITQWGRLESTGKKAILEKVAVREYEAMYPPHKKQQS